MDGSRKVLILPVSLFQDVPDDKIPTRVTDTYTLEVIFIIGNCETRGARS